MQNLFDELIQISEINKPEWSEFLVQLAQRYGWIHNTKEGKGSHSKLEQEGYQFITLHENEYHPSVLRQQIRKIIQPEIDRIVRENYVKIIDEKLKDLIDDLQDQVNEMAMSKAITAYEAFNNELVKKQSELEEKLQSELAALESLKHDEHIRQSENINALQARIEYLEQGIRKIQTWRQNYAEIRDMEFLQARIHNLEQGVRRIYEWRQKQNEY